MSLVKFQGEPVDVSGLFPQTGSSAPEFCLTGGDLSDLTLSSFAGKNVVLNIFPSVDTPVCATSVRQFNQQASRLPDMVVVCVSADLPFAVSRFCQIEGIEGVQHASTFRSPDFAKAYGVDLSSGALRGLTARAVVCIDKNRNIVHSELVSEITHEPNYEAAINAFG
ncbi:thiol peroxidase [Vibrio sp.]|uniref:thiol peroxidase n=1 Tax=Vibrio sp. TaxID=678 RepID=UPI00311E0469